MPDFSIAAIIPAFNRRAFLGQAIDSVISQTHPVDEIIVVDDGSDDGTAAFLANQYPDITVIFQENQGVSAARNTGIRAAGSDWIALLDSDDAWAPEKIAKQYEAIRSSHDAVLCHTEEAWVYKGKSRPVAKAYRKRGGWIFEQCTKRCAICPSAAVLKKQTLLDLGGFDPQFPVCEDYDLWLRICAKHPVLLVDEPLVEKRGGHEDQLSNRTEMDRYRIQSLCKLLDARQLDAGQTRSVLAELSRKCGLYAKGLTKHGKVAQAREIADIDVLYAEKFSLSGDV